MAQYNIFDTQTMKAEFLNIAIILELQNTEKAWINVAQADNDKSTTINWKLAIMRRKTEI